MAVEQPCSHLVFWNWDLINVAEKNKVIIFFFSALKRFIFSSRKGTCLEVTVNGWRTKNKIGASEYEGEEKCRLIYFVFIPTTHAHVCYCCS